MIFEATFRVAFFLVPVYLYFISFYPNMFKY